MMRSHSSLHSLIVAGVCRHLPLLGADGTSRSPSKYTQPFPTKTTQHNFDLVCFWAWHR